MMKHITEPLLPVAAAVHLLAMTAVTVDKVINKFKGEPLARVAPASTRDRIAFACKRDGNWEIYAVDGEGRQQVRLTTLASQDRYPVWSPDGRKIAFESQADGRVDDSSK